MRWVWRAEAGAGKIEYAALVILAGAIAAALLAAGLPTDVKPAVTSAVCKLVGASDCAPTDEGGDGGDADGPSNDPSTPADGSEGQDEGDDDVPQDQALLEAEGEYNDAQYELAESESGFGGIDKELLDLLAELIGLADAKRCLFEGDIASCIWTGLGLIGPLKLFKVASKIPKMWKLFDRWRDLSKVRTAAKARYGKAKSKMEDALDACGLAGVTVAGSATPQFGSAIRVQPAMAGAPPGAATSAAVDVGGAEIVPVGKKKNNLGCKYVPAPDSLTGFPGAKRAKPKTSVQGGGGKRKRWKDDDGNIYEWDSQHGTVEKYNKRGRHQGEYDVDGNQTKPADKTRKVEP